MHDELNIQNMGSSPIYIYIYLESAFSVTRRRIEGVGQVGVLHDEVEAVQSCRITEVGQVLSRELVTVITGLTFKAASGFDETA